MRRLLPALLLLIPLLMSAREDPPQVEIRGGTERNFTITGSSLHIVREGDNNYLLFSGGVKCATGAFSLVADVLELDLDTSNVTGGQAFSMPSKVVTEERVVEDPGAAIREMASEMKIPSAHFSASAIKRVAAAGNVVVTAKDLTLVTQELVSKDGGRSWSTNSRSTLKHSGADKKCYEIAADYILYDTADLKALAKGGIKGLYTQPDYMPVSIEAERVELDVADSTITVSEYLLVEYEGFLLRCGSLAADISGDKLEATSSPHLESTKDSIGADAGIISVDLAGMVVVAAGGVVVRDEERNLVLECGSIVADLKANRLEARENPVLTHNGSTYSGSLITVFDEGGKVVIEVDGPQSAHLDLDDLGNPGGGPKGP